MKPLCRHLELILLAIVALMLVATGNAPAQEQQKEMFPPIALKVVPNRAQYWMGEPVVLKMRMTNWLSPWLNVYSSYGLQGSTDVRIIHNQTTSERYYAHMRQQSANTQPVILRYAKSHEFRIAMEYSTEGPSYLAFKEPGEYEIRVSQSLEYINRYSPDTTRKPYFITAFSPTISFIEPPPEAKGAWNLLKADPNALRDLNALTATPATRPLLERIAKEFPKSRYAPYCLQALGSLSLQLMPLIPGEDKKAQEYLKRVIDEYPDYPLRDEVRIHLAAVYQSTMQYDEANQIAIEMLNESEDNLYRFMKSDIMKPYRGSKDNPNIFLNQSAWEFFGTTELPDAYAQLRIEFEL